MNIILTVSHSVYCCDKTPGPRQLVEEGVCFSSQLSGKTSLLREVPGQELRTETWRQDLKEGRRQGFRNTSATVKGQQKIGKEVDE